MTLAACAGDAEETLLKANLAVAITCRTRGRSGTLLRAAAIAFRAGFVPGNLDLGRRSECRLFESEIQVVSKIGAALDAAA